MFQPTPRRFRKVNRHPLRHTYESKSNRLRFGIYGIQTLESGFLTPQQLEAVRRTLTSRRKRKRKFWLRALPDYPRTAKPSEVRRGRGKGNVDHWVCVLKPGRILLEATTSPREEGRLREALQFALRKLPVFAQVVGRTLLFVYFYIMAYSVSSHSTANSSKSYSNGFLITTGFAFWSFYVFSDLFVASSFTGLTFIPSTGTLLTLLLLVPLVSILFLLLRGSSTAVQQYRLGLRSTALSFLFTLRLWVAKNKLSTDFEGVFTISLLPSRALPIRLGVDGLSLPLLVLTNAFLYLCILSLSPATPRIREALLHLIFLQWAVLGTFLALDFLAFFVFFERTLIPIYFLVLLWGSRERRVRAGYRISLYTLFGSIFRLFTILALLAKAGTTDYGRLLQLTLSVDDQRLLWILLFLAFATKIPLFPLHIWLPEAHVEAPTIGSVLLAVVLLKLGTYGLLRFALPLFPEGTVYWAPLVSVFAVRGILYTSLTAIRQIDLKKIIAYSSVGHRNLVLLGRRSGTREGLQGAIFQRLSHGVVSGGLFFGVGVLYERYGVRSLKYYGGRAHLYPLFTTRFLLLSLANISFPLTSSFVGEFLLFLGIFQHSLWATVAAATSRVLGAAYTLWAFNRIFFGNLRTLSIDAGQDLTRKEFALFAPLAVLVLWRGIAPSTILSAFLVDCERVLTQTRSLFFL